MFGTISGSAKRKIIQLAALIGSNPFPGNFVSGTVHRGPTKAVCVPGLNCYSCPAAAASCPVGSMQSVLSGRTTSISLYVTGFLVLFGTVFGRFICGFLCPFGLYQEALHALPGRKLTLPQRLKGLGYLRYPVFIGLVILAPLFLVDSFGYGTSAFCAWVCPAGTLQAGIPIVSVQESLRAITGALFNWKVSLLIFLSALSVVLYRPFCRFLCPLGLIYGWFNRISLHRITVDSHRCTSCGVCTDACRLDIPIHLDPGTSECIRCGDCVRACPHGAVSMGFSLPGKRSG